MEGKSCGNTLLAFTEDQSLDDTADTIVIQKGFLTKETSMPCRYGAWLQQLNIAILIIFYIQLYTLLTLLKQTNKDCTGAVAWVLSSFGPGSMCLLWRANKSDGLNPNNQVQRVSWSYRARYFILWRIADGIVVAKENFTKLSCFSYTLP